MGKNPFRDAAKMLAQIKEETFAPEKVKKLREKLGEMQKEHDEWLKKEGLWEEEDSILTEESLKDENIITQVGIGLDILKKFRESCNSLKETEDKINKILKKHLKDEETKKENKWDPKQDTVTHINIYFKGKDPLGRWLSNLTHCPIETEDGKFSSIEGYWYWLTCKDDRLRTLYGFDAKMKGREYRGEDWCEDSEFKEKIKKAIEIKIKKLPHRYKEFINSKLPFTHYYNYGGKVVEPKSGKWIVEHIEQLRKNLS